MTTTKKTWLAVTMALLCFSSAIGTLGLYSAVPPEWRWLSELHWLLAIAIGFSLRAQTN